MPPFSMKVYDHFVEQVASFLDKETLHGAKHVDFGQWELPFEAVLIALTKVDREEIDLDFSIVEDLAKEAEITVEGVLDPASWAKFLKWERGQ